MAALGFAVIATFYLGVLPTRVIDYALRVHSDDLLTDCLQEVQEFRRQIGSVYGGNSSFCLKADSCTMH